MVSPNLDELPTSMRSLELLVDDSLGNDSFSQPPTVLCSRPQEAPSSSSRLRDISFYPTPFAV